MPPNLRELLLPHSGPHLAQYSNATTAWYPSKSMLLRHLMDSDSEGNPITF
jgi:hypothetical protein